MTVKIKSADNSFVLIGAPSTTVNIALTCESTYVCSGYVLNSAFSSLYVTSGTATSSSYKILSSGNFVFTASYSTWTSGSANTGTITNNIASCDLNVPNPIYTYYYFTPSLTLKGEDSQLFLLATTVTISDVPSGKLQGTLSASNSGGTVTFTPMYYNNGFDSGTVAWSFTGTPYVIPAGSKTVTVNKSVIKAVYNPSTVIFT